MFDSELKPLPRDAALCEELPPGEWETVQLHGCWKKGQSAGGSRNFPSFHINPSFPLSIPAGPGKSSVKVTLRQHCQDSKCRPIGFHIFQVRHLLGSAAHVPRGKVSQAVQCSFHLPRDLLLLGERLILCRNARGRYGVTTELHSRVTRSLVPLNPSGVLN